MRHCDGCDDKKAPLIRLADRTTGTQVMVCQPCFEGKIYPAILKVLGMEIEDALPDSLAFLYKKRD